MAHVMDMLPDASTVGRGSALPYVSSSAGMRTAPCLTGWALSTVASCCTPSGTTGQTSQLRCALLLPAAACSGPSYSGSRPLC